MHNSESNASGPGGFREEFARMMTRPEEDLDLGLAALLVAGEEYPELDAAEYLRRLDGYADAVRQLANSAATFSRIRDSKETPPTTTTPTTVISTGCWIPILGYPLPCRCSS